MSQQARLCVPERVHLQPQPARNVKPLTTNPDHLERGDVRSRVVPFPLVVVHDLYLGWSRLVVGPCEADAPLLIHAD